MSAFNGGPAQTQSLNVPVGATPISTWANLPDPSTIPGLVYRVTDFGVAGVGVLVISDGTRWVPLGPQVLARSAVASTITGTLTKTVLASVTVPGGLLGANGRLRVTTSLSVNNSANAKTVGVDYGGNSVRSASVTTTGRWFADLMANRNGAASQVVYFTNDQGVIALTTLATNSAVDQPLTFYGTLTNVADSATLDDYLVEVLP